MFVIVVKTPSHGGVDVETAAESSRMTPKMFPPSASSRPL